MKWKRPLVVAGALMFFFSFYLWQIWYLRVDQQISLAYPPPPTNQYSYPGPPTHTPSITSTNDEIKSEITNTPTPWPTPTSYVLLTTPTGTIAPRQGLASSNPLIADRHYLGSWQWTYSAGLPLGSYPNNIEHIPQLISRPWGVASYNPTLTPLPTHSITAMQTVASQTPHQYWLIFNECESIHQCATTPALAAESYFQHVERFIADVDPEAKLIIGGVNAHECGILWLIHFLKHFQDNYERDPLYIAGWHFHLYPGVTASAWSNGASCHPDDNPPGPDWPFYAWHYNDDRVATPDKAWAAWQEDVWNIYRFMQEYGQPDHEVWITEMGCLNPDGVCVQEGYMYEFTAQITGWLNSPLGRWIDRYAWYTDRILVGNKYRYTWLYAESALTPTPTILAGTPTPTPGHLYSALGNYYARITPAPAGEFNELLPEKRYMPVIMIP